MILSTSCQFCISPLIIGRTRRTLLLLAIAFSPTKLLLHTPYRKLFCIASGSPLTLGIVLPWQLSSVLVLITRYNYNTRYMILLPIIVGIIPVGDGLPAYPALLYKLPRSMTTGALSSMLRLQMNSRKLAIKGR
jgi:hypothetical protein